MSGERTPGEHTDAASGGSEVHRNAWQRTLEDMEATAEEREADGWETLTVAAGDTAPEYPDAGDSDRFGLVHVVPGNKADEIAAFVESGSFPRYDVYRADVQNRVFLVTELLDPETERSILVAATYERPEAMELIGTARERDEMYTHLQRLDGTPIATFEHSDVEKFFPTDE